MPADYYHSPTPLLSEPVRPRRPWQSIAVMVTVGALLALSVVAILLISPPWSTQGPTPSPSVSPTATPSPTPTIDPVQQQINSMSIRDKVAAMLILHTPGVDSAVITNFVSTYHPAGLILMGDNIPASADQLNTLTEKVQTGSAVPLLLAVDEEGCTVKRLPWDTLACAKDLGGQPTATTQSIFGQRGQLLQQTGLNTGFSVVADVTSDTSSFIYPRVFSGNPVVASDQVAAAVRGMQSAGVLATLKHFPGHGETEDNSHTTIPVVQVDKARWQQQDKPPFMAGISAGAKMVMFGHLTYSQIDSQPASLSSAWHQLLRQEMGFNGVTVTDDMVMLQQSKLAQYQDPVKNTIAAINAGNDLILFVTNHQTGESNIDVNGLINGLVQAVERGDIAQSTLDGALHRTLSLRMAL